MEEEHHRVVVGVDDSVEAGSVLSLALKLASLMGAELDVVNVFTPMHEAVPVPASFVPAPVASSPSIDHAEAISRQLMADLLTEYAPGVERPAPAVVRTIAAEGSTGEVLVDNARGADLLVVGTHRPGVLARVLGSVSTHCVHHAPCPIVLVPVDH